MADEVVFNWDQPRTGDEAFELILGFTEAAAVFRRDEIYPTIETAYNRWSFKQVGIIRTAITVTNVETGQIEAAYRVNFRGGGGTAQLRQTNTRFTWRAINSKKFEWLDAENNVWGRFYLEVNPQGKRGHLETTQERVDQDEFELLMVIGWYLCINQLGFKEGINHRLMDGTPGNGGPSRL